MPKASIPTATSDSIPATTVSSPKSFETALAELERLVGKMESGALTLEQSLAAHQRGLELAKFCQDLLARAEQQVKVLEDDMLKTLPNRAGTPAEDDDD